MRGGGTHDLREPRQAWRDAPSEVVARRQPSEPRHIRPGQRPRTDGAHVAPEDVHELRQLVEAGRAKEPSHARDMAVAHGAEFQNGEEPPIAAVARLTEEDRAAIFDQDRGGHECHNWPEDEESRQRTKDVEQAS